MVQREQQHTRAESDATRPGGNRGQPDQWSRIQHRAVVVLAEEDRVEPVGLGALAFLNGLLE
jgi:hypothetical protein